MGRPEWVAPASQTVGDENGLRFVASAIAEGAKATKRREEHRQGAWDWRMGDTALIDLMKRDHEVSRGYRVFEQQELIHGARSSGCHETCDLHLEFLSVDGNDIACRRPGDGHDVAAATRRRPWAGAASAESRWHKIVGGLGEGKRPGQCRVVAGATSKTDADVESCLLDRAVVDGLVAECNRADGSGQTVMYGDTRHGHPLIHHTALQVRIVRHSGTPVQKSGAGVVARDGTSVDAATTDGAGEAGRHGVDGGGIRHGRKQHGKGENGRGNDFGEGFHGISPGQTAACSKNTRGFCDRFGRLLETATTATGAVTTATGIGTAETGVAKGVVTKVVARSNMIEHRFYGRERCGIGPT